MDNPFTLELLTKLKIFNDELVKSAKGSAMIGQADAAVRKLQHSRMLDSILAYVRGTTVEHWQQSKLCE